MASLHTPIRGDVGRYRSITKAERRLVGLNEAADMLGLSRSKAHLLVQAGELEPVRIGRRLLITVESIDALIERSRSQ